MVLFYIIKEGFSSQSTIEPNAVVALYTFYIEVVSCADFFIQGVRTQTVTSNLDLTGRKYAINFNLNVDSDQGRLEI